MNTPVLVVGLGQPTSGQVQQKKNERANTLPETLALYNVLTATKLGSHRLDGLVAGVAVHGKSIITPRTSKATTAIFTVGREAPVSRFASPEELGPLTYSSDGAHIVAGGVSGSLYVWEACSGHLLCAWKAHYRKVTAVVFTDDNAALISSSEDAMVHVWDFGTCVMNATAPEKGLLTTFSLNKLAVTSLSIGTGGVFARIVSSSMDHTCRIFRAVTEKEELCVTFSSSLLCVALDLAETQCYAGSVDGYLHFVDLVDGTTSSLPAHSGSITSMVVVPTTAACGFALVTGSDDAMLKWWDPISKSPLRSLKTEGSYRIRCLAMVGLDLRDKMKSEADEPQKSLKKLKEDDADTRWIIGHGCRETKRKRTSFIESESFETSGNRVIHAKDESINDTKMLSIANRLYNLVSKQTLDSLIANKRD